MSSSTSLQPYIRDIAARYAIPGAVLMQLGYHLSRGVNEYTNYATEALSQAALDAINDLVGEYLPNKTAVANMLSYVGDEISNAVVDFVDPIAPTAINNDGMDQQIVHMKNQPSKRNRSNSVTSTPSTAATKKMSRKGDKKSTYTSSSSLSTSRTVSVQPKAISRPDKILYNLRTSSVGNSLRMTKTTPVTIYDNQQYKLMNLEVMCEPFIWRYATLYDSGNVGIRTVSKTTQVKYPVNQKGYGNGNVRQIMAIRGIKATNLSRYLEFCTIDIGCEGSYFYRFSLNHDVSIRKVNSFIPVESGTVSSVIRLGEYIKASQATDLPMKNWFSPADAGSTIALVDAGPLEEVSFALSKMEERNANDIVFFEKPILYPGNHLCINIRNNYMWPVLQPSANIQTVCTSGSGLQFDGTFAGYYPGPNMAISLQTTLGVYKNTLHAESQVQLQFLYDFVNVTEGEYQKLTQAYPGCLLNEPFTDQGTIRPLLDFPVASKLQFER